MSWNYVPAYAPKVNIFQVYDLTSGRLIHQVSNYLFYQFITGNFPLVCIEYTPDGCIKASMSPFNYNTAYFYFYGVYP